MYFRNQHASVLKFTPLPTSFMVVPVQHKTPPRTCVWIWTFI